jgi:hypothetical protein
MPTGRHRFILIAQDCCYRVIARASTGVEKANLAAARFALHRTTAQPGDGHGQSATIPVSATTGELRPVSLDGRTLVSHLGRQ